MEPIGFHSILILLGVAVVLVALFRYLHLPQILAYLCAGIVVGPMAVSAVRRGGIRGPEPAPETRLAAGDVLVLYGAPEALEQAEKILLKG
jgi:Kef-type K+ transport system membrane component KefB